MGSEMTGYISRIPWVLSTLLALSCSMGGDDYRLRGDEVERLERRRSRMNVRVRDLNGDASEMAPEAFRGVVDADCESAAAALTQWACALPVSGTPDLNNSCRDAACISTAALCAANRYLELGGAIEPVDIGGYTVPPQSNATRAGFYEMATYLNSVALNVSGEALRTPYVIEGYLSGKAPTPGCTKDDLAIGSSDPEITMADILIGNVAESTVLVREAAGSAVRANIAHADAEPSRTPDLVLAKRAGWHDPFLSRGRAAQLLFGDVNPESFNQTSIDYGLPSSCELPRLTQRGREALGYVRSSGISPAAVRGDDPMDLFLNDQDGVIPRLQTLLDLPDLDPGNEIDAFLEAHHVSEADFVEARAHLRCELDAFPRDETEAENRNGVLVYRATELAPRRHRGEAQWAEMLAAEAHHQIVGSQDSPPRDANEPMRGAAYALDYARKLTVELTTLEVAASPPDLVTTSQRDFIGSVAAETSMTSGPDITSCVYEASPGVLGVRVIVDDDGNIPEADYIVAGGAQTLECAILGSVDGESCALSEPDVRQVSVVSSTPPSSAGYTRRLTFTYTVDTIPSYGLRDFVLKRRPGLVGRPPGGFELVAPAVGAPSASMTTLNPGEQICDHVPSGTGVEEHAQNALANAPDDLPDANTGCEDMPTLPVALEAELTDDGDRYETSWRRQLETARVAAEQADALGTEMIAEGAAIDARAEAAQAEIARLCGVSVDLTAIFDDQLTDITAGSCTGPGSCPSGYRCVGEACVLDPIQRIQNTSEDGRTDRILGECLGYAEGSVLPVVSLGSSPLCVWADEADPSVICHPSRVAHATDADRKHPCPFVRTGATCQLNSNFALVDDPMTMAPAAALQSVEHNLGIFEADTAETGPTGAAPPDPSFDCGQAIRDIRSVVPLTAGELDWRVQRLLESHTLSRSTVYDAAARIGWRGELGDFSAITVDGAPVFSTGTPYPDDPVDRVGTGWPCAARTGIDCVGSDALFCTEWNCSARTNRAQANYRLARAAATLGVISGFGISNVDIPVAVVHGIPSLSTTSPGAAETPWIGYLVDGGATAVELLQTNAPAWHDSGVRAFSGRGYYVPEGTAQHWIWSGHGSGGHISSPGIATDYGTNPDCNGTTDTWCRITLTSDEVPASDYARRIRWFAFARIGDDFWQGDVRSRERWIASLWYGMDPRVGPHEYWREWGIVRRVLSDPERDWPIAELSTAGGALTDYTHLHNPPFTFIDVGTNQGNYSRLFDIPNSSNPHGITRSDVLDALELACYSASPEGMNAGCRDLPPPTLTSEADIPAVRQYLTCLASSIETASERMVAQHLPRLVVEGMSGGAGATTPLEGQFGAAASGARETILMLREQPEAIAVQVRGFEHDLELYEVAIRQAEIRREMVDWRSAQEAISAAATCAEIAERNASGSFGGGIARCGAALANLAISFRISDLERETTDLDETRHLIDVQRAMEGRVSALQGIESQISRLLNQLNGHLATLNGTQSAARIALGNAMFSSSVPGRTHLAELPHVAPINTVMRRRYSTSRYRYDRALNRARRAAVLARRSLEQRLGMSVADMDDLVLVSDPGSLAVASCELGGLDYSRIRDDGWPGSPGGEPESYADGYIGDYVRDLQAVLDSYPYRYPYTDGTDTMVVSVRDDLLRVRRSCTLPSKNLLAGSSGMEGTSWSTTGCGGDPSELCIGVRSLDVRDVRAGDTQPGPLASGLRYRQSPDEAPLGFRFDFGVNPTVSAATRRGQALALPHPGTYRLSWYGRQVGMGPVPSSVVLVEGDVGTVGAPLEVTDSSVLASSWHRYVRFVDVTGSGNIEIYVDAGSSPGQSVELGGLMLEAVPHLGGAGTIDGTTLAADPTVYAPGLYAGTDDAGLSRQVACEDTFGTAFRAATDWSRRCDTLCSNGLFGECPAGEVPSLRCYWELPLKFERGSVVAGDQFGSAGFAHGNFNYRIERIGLNVVGTASRSCEDAASPSTCYAAGWIPYSLRHLPPYEVVNHQGVLYSTPLFTGGVDSARALAAERYLTNPMSGADRALIEPFMRDDLHGRPLSGRMNLRIWDVPGVDFNGIEDIQLVIDYRYWNRSRAPVAAE